MRYLLRAYLTGYALYVDLFFFFALGTVLASFLGVVTARLYTGMPIAKGRSACDACGRTLSPKSLVPIVSYVASGARARCCGARLSFLFPLGELLLGTLFVIAYLHLGVTNALAFVLIALSLLFGLVAYDIAHQILPPVLLWPFVLVAAGAGYLQAGSLQGFLVTAGTAVGIGAFLALIHVVSRGRAMGLADAPLATGLALLTGPLAFSGFIYAFWIGAVFGIVMLLGRPAGSRMGIEVPFAPYLCAGFLLAYFTQWNILDILALSPLA